jgi:hypothetical protein
MSLYAAGVSSMTSLSLRHSTPEVAAQNPHLRYEAELLRTLRGARPRWRRALVECANRALLSVAARLVYREHQGVLAFVGHDARSFLQVCRSLYRTVLAAGGARAGATGFSRS